MQPASVDSLDRTPAGSQYSVTGGLPAGTAQQGVGTSFDILWRMHAGSPGWRSSYSMGSNCSTLLIQLCIATIRAVGIYREPAAADRVLWQYELHRAARRAGTRVEGVHG